MPSDLPRLMELMRKHADFENGAPPEATQAQLSAALFAEPRPLRAWLAIRRTAIIGYVTATVDFSTWRGRRFLHMDCCFVEDGHRGAGAGKQLVGALVASARAENIDEMQWQAPQWNESAARFYQRLGASELLKRRFIWKV